MSYNSKTGKYEGFIYCIKNDINSLMYIGQTSSTLKHRFSSHKHESKSNRYNSLIHNAMQKYGFEHFYIEQLLKIECDAKEELIGKLNEKEIEYINIYNTIRPNGYNIAIGGGNFGTPARKIDFYTNDGVFIRCYNNASDAAYDNNIVDATVYDLCNGNTSYSPVGVFRYHGDSFNKFPVQDLRNKESVDVYNTVGHYICTCESFVEASIKFDIDPASVCGVCRGYHSHSNYFVFRYSGDSFDKYIVKSFVVGKYNSNNELINIYLCPNECMTLNNISSQKMHGHLSGRIQCGRDGYHYRYVTCLEEYNNFLNNTKLIKEVS